MSRQAGPSIVLSVLIVCFFAVALFQRDLPHTERRPIRPSRQEPAARPLAPKATARARPEQRARTAQGEISARAGSNLPTGVSAQTSARTSKKRRSASSLISSGPRNAAPTHNPRSAFTIALREETIEAISSRVYGTTEFADLLWRANRDTLPKRDSPVSTGMLLRTPSLR
jgi:hypothetical protein